MVFSIIVRGFVLHIPYDGHRFHHLTVSGKQWWNLIMEGLKTVCFLVEQYFKNIIIRIDSISGVSRGVLRVLQHPLTSLSSKLITTNRISARCCSDAVATWASHETTPSQVRAVFVLFLEV